MSLFKVKSSIDELPEPKEGIVIIYTLINNGECVYVGQSTNLKNRLYSHLADGKVFSDVDFFECSPEQANEKEADQIVKSNPLLNKSLPKTDKYTTLSDLKNKICKAVVDNAELVGVAFSSGSESSNKPGYTYLESSRADKLVSGVVSYLKSFTG